MKRVFFGIVGIACAIVSCKKEQPVQYTTYVPSEKDTLHVSFSNLPTLGASSQYELWIVTTSYSIVSLGKFNFPPKPSSEVYRDLDTAFFVANRQAAYINSVMLSIEPSDDTDPGVAQTKLIAGSFKYTSPDTLYANFENPLAFGTNFLQRLKAKDAKFKFILATPTDGTTTDETSGVWFMEPSSNGGTAGLEDLPSLPAGWTYEGWLMKSGTPPLALSTGKFFQKEGKDASSPYSGTSSGYDFPGEDFLKNLPSGAGNSPLQIAANDEVLITIEPSLDDDQSRPFGLGVFRYEFTSAVVSQTPYTLEVSLGKNVPLPTARVVRKR